MKRLLKWLGKSLLALVILLLILLALLWYLLGTDNGFSTLSQQISKRVEGLDLGTVEGNLGRGVDSDAIAFSSEAIAINASGLDTDWRLSCLTQREFCLDKIIIDELNIETFATEKPEEPASTGPIELPAINLPLNVTIDEILIRKLSFKAPGEAPVQVINDIRLSVNAEGNVLNIDTISAAYQDYTLQLAGGVTLDGDYPLALNLALDASDLIPDTLPEGEGQQPASIRVALGNTLRNLEIGTEVTGTVQATLNAQLQPLEKNLPAHIQLDSPALGWPITSNSQVKASTLSVRIDGSLDDYQLSVKTHIEGEQVPATDLDIIGLANTERATISSIDIATLGGSAKGSADVSWKDLLQWKTQWKIKDIDPSLQAPSVTGNLSGQFLASGVVKDGNWSVNLPTAKINGVLREYPLDLNAQLSKGLNNVWKIDNILLSNGDNQVKAAGKVSDTWDIKADLKLPQLQNLLPELAGGFNADIKLAGALATPNIDIASNSSVIKYNDILVEGFSINGDINELFVKDSNLTIAVGTVQSGPQTVRNTRLALTGKRSDHHLALFADGPDATAIDLTASGALSKSFDWKGSLDKVRLDAPAHIIKLKQATALSWNNAKKLFSIDAHCWTTEDSNLCLEEKVEASASGTAAITLDHYALNRLDPFMPAETSLQGSLSVDSIIKWGKDQPGGFAATIATLISDGGAQVVDAEQNPVTLTYDKLTLNTDVNPTAVNAHLSLTSKNLGQADVSVQLDPAGEEKPIQGTLSLQGLDVSIAKAFLPDFEEVSGTISLEGDLSGQLTDPRFDGELLLDEPILRAEALPLPISGGQLIVTVKGKRAVVDGKILSDEGSLSLDGSANWQQASAWRADVTLTGDNLNLNSPPLEESSINHEIKIGARPGIIRVNGDINIPMAIINVADLPEGAASMSDDVVIIEDVEEEPNEPVKSPSDTKLQVALNVILGDDVNLSAYGLNALLTGDMTVKVNGTNPPQLGGEIEVVDGIFKQYGQDLVANGQILFVGPVNQTRLAIDAIREIEAEDREVGLRIQGTVAKPEITLFTEPDDKSEDAVLSYIVLGRDINEASDQEANLLATAALALSVRGGRSIVGGFAKAIGVEDFAMETRGNGDDTELVVSGRVSEKLLLRYGRSLFAGAESTIYLRYDLTKKLYLEAAQGAEEAVDLFYSFSF